MRKDGIVRILCLLLVLSMMVELLVNPRNVVEAAASSQKTYTIKDNLKPSSKIQKYSTYNKYTNDWYLFNEILKKCELAGGGIVDVKKGNYTICRAVEIPSNVTLILEDGVIIKKATKTGTSKLKATKTLFELVEPSKANVAGAHSLYNGVHNVNIKGKGKSVVDLSFMEGAVGFVMAHNKDISFENVTFKNMNTGHFIEMDASLDVTVNNCTFTGSKISPKQNKEAINIDTPDKLTGGFTHTWTSYDKTPDKNITITNCTFNEIDAAIGTHKYSQQPDSEGKYTINMVHKNITIQKCKFLNIRKSSLNILNWENTLVENNLFDGGKYPIFNPTTGKTIYIGSTAFVAKAVTKFTFRNNTISNMQTIGGSYGAPMGQADAVSLYTALTCNITKAEIEIMKTNKCINLELPHICFVAYTSELSSGGTYYLELENAK